MGDQGPKGNVKAGQKGKYMEIRRTQCSLQQVKALVLSGFQALAGGAVLARLVLCLQAGAVLAGGAVGGAVWAAGAG